MPKVGCRSTEYIEVADCCRYKPDRHVSRGAGDVGAPDPFSSSSSDDAHRSGEVGSDGGGSYSDTETESDEETDWVTPQVSLSQHARQAITSEQFVHLVCTGMALVACATRAALGQRGSTLRRNCAWRRRSEG